MRILVNNNTWDLVPVSEPEKITQRELTANSNELRKENTISTDNWESYLLDYHLAGPQQPNRAP